MMVLKMLHLASDTAQEQGLYDLYEDIVGVVIKHWDAEMLRTVSATLSGPSGETAPFDGAASMIPRDRGPGYQIPSGKHRGRYLSELTDTDLKHLWRGYNGAGSGYAQVAEVIYTEIQNRRKVNG